MDWPTAILYLIKVCTRFGGYSFKDFHIPNEELTSSRDFSRISTISPACGDNRVRQTFSPGRVKSCGLRVYTRDLPASNKAIGEILRSSLRLDNVKKKFFK